MQHSVVICFTEHEAGSSLTRLQLDHVQNELPHGRVHLGQVVGRVVLPPPIRKQLHTPHSTLSCGHMPAPQLRQQMPWHTFERSKSALFSRKSSAMTHPVEKTSCAHA